MKKAGRKIIRTFTALLLSLSLFGNSVAYGSGPVPGADDTSSDPSGALGALLIGHCVNIAIESGFAAAGLAVTGIAESTDSEELQKVASFVSSWVLGNRTDNAIDKVAAICEEILAEVKLVDEHLTDYTTVIEGMLADQNIRLAYDKRNEVWHDDVTDKYEEYGVSTAYDAYTAYMQAAVDYKNDGTPAKKTAYEAAERRFYQTLLFIYQQKVPAMPAAQVEENAMTGNVIDLVLLDDIHNMCSAMCSDKGNFTEYSAKLAHQAFAFSDEEYRYVYASMADQIITITNLLLMYQDLVGRQSAYIYANYTGDELKEQEALLEQRVNALSQLNLYFQQSLQTLLETPINIDSGIQLTFSQYMQPEDAASATLQNTEFVDYISSRYWWDHEESIRDDFKSIENLESYVGAASSFADRFSAYLPFRRVGVNTAEGVEVYYVFDGKRYRETSDKADTKMLALDYKRDVKHDYDVHFPSADYYNSVRGNFYDGHGYWSLVQDGKETGKIYKLFNTNYFRSGSCSSKVGPYLGSLVDYPGMEKWYLMMPELGYDLNRFSTSYEQFHMVDPDASNPGDSLAVAEYSAGEFQSGGKQKNAEFALVLPAKAEDAENFGCSVHVSGKNEPITSIKVLENGRETDAVISEGGKTETLRIKVKKDFSVELRLERYDDRETGRVSSSRIICDDIVSQMVPVSIDDDYITYDIPCRVPYSPRAYFVIKETRTGVKPIGYEDSGEQETVYLMKGNPYTLSQNLMTGVTSIDLEPGKPKFIKVNKKTGAVSVLRAGECTVTMHYSGREDHRFRVVTDVPKAVKRTVYNLAPISARTLVSGAGHTAITDIVSSKPGVAEADKDHEIIIPKGPGTSKITLTYGGRKVSVKLKVVRPKLNKGRYTIKAGLSKDVQLKVKNMDRDSGVLSWRSDDPRVISISHDENTGKVTFTAMSRGTAGIYAHLSDGTEVGPCKVKVK